jgi:Holliday junction resolvasome RuvABC ATP-dependent DNA helicase subunit
MTKTTEYFPTVVGQDRAKRKLSYLLDNWKSSKIMDNLMFVAPRGCGKTMMATLLAKAMKTIDNGKVGRIVNCASIKNLNQFINGTIIPYVHDKNCTILLDEASELPRDVEMALLTILNPNPENRNTFSYEDYTINFDFRRQTFLLATTEAHKVFHALKDRLNRIDLEEYESSHLAEIIRRSLVNAEFEGSVLEEISTVLRCNARQAQHMANQIRNHLTKKKSKKFTRRDWEQMQWHLGIRPLGLNENEILCLRALAEKKASSLTCISAKLGMSKEVIQRDIELYLQKLNLMEISTDGRAITPRGQKYLKRHVKVSKRNSGRD